MNAIGGGKVGTKFWTPEMHEWAKEEIVRFNDTVGDVLLYDKTAKTRIFVNPDELSNYPAELYSPLGVLVIPASYDVYGTGQCGVMSLKYMRYDTPDVGGSYQSMYWGQYGTGISSLTNFNTVVQTGTMAEPTVEASGTNNITYLPSDKFTGTTCPTDSITKYYYATGTTQAAPSPYLEDGSRNPVYYQTSSPSSANNALSDFNGKSNTQILCDLATAQVDWQTASAITNNSAAGYSPAACCCWRYCPEGTEQGEWHLPACGELGYIIPRWNVIKSSLNKINSEYGSGSAVVLDESGNHWSSSEYSSHSARSVSTGNGSVHYDLKNNSYFARAFLQI